MTYPTTPDARYFVVRGQLWRTSDPALDAGQRSHLVGRLMDARRAVKAGMANDDPGAVAKARQDVHDAKIALGERGQPWWTDGAPDYNRRLVRNTPYRKWFETLPSASTADGAASGGGQAGGVDPRELGKTRPEAGSQ